jgi:hypothetical protein
MLSWSRTGKIAQCAMTLRQHRAALQTGADLEIISG